MKERSYLYPYEVIRFTFLIDFHIKRCLCKSAVHRAGVKGQERLDEEKWGVKPRQLPVWYPVFRAEAWVIDRSRDKSSLCEARSWSKLHSAVHKDSWGFSSHGKNNMQSAQFGWDLGNMQISSLGEGFVCCLFVWVGQTSVICNPVHHQIPRWTNRFGDRYTTKCLYVWCVCLNKCVLIWETVTGSVQLASGLYLRRSHKGEEMDRQLGISAIP